LGSSSTGGIRGEGSRGGGGGDESTDSKVEPSNSKEEEEYEEEGNMADQKLEWMTQGPLALHGDFHKIPRHAEKLLMKYNLDRAVKVEDHLNTLYLHLWTLEVHYDDVACRLFPYTLNGRVVVWYHNFPTNSIQNWGMLKRILLEKFFNDKTHTMLLKESGSLKMEPKEKVKDFN